MNNYKSIAIDGPAASGKSAVGEKLASKLFFHFLDTGIMYRAVTFVVIDSNIDPVEVSAFFKDSKLKIDFGQLQNKIIYRNKDITNKLFTDQVDSKVSEFSKIKAVRENLVLEQKKIAKNNNIIMAGRDIGTKVLPNSNLKIYLDASIEVRANRRASEIGDISTEEIKAKIESRDIIDKNRENSPLKIDRDAFVINTDDFDVDGVVEKIMDLYTYD